MRGFPANPVPCEVCGRPGYPKNRRCLAHWPPTAKLKYPFDAAKDAIVRAAWMSAGDRDRLKAAITDATRRIGYPRHIIRLRAQRLGITFDTRHKWTASEEDYLMQNAGVVPIKIMQKKLGHGHAAIMAKIGSMRLRYGIKEGMSQGDLAAALGVAHQTMTKWEREGVIKRRMGRFTEEEVKAFIRKHPELYDLRRVDQSWFKALVFPMAKCFSLGQAEDWRKPAAGEEPSTVESCSA